jgi:hypothetical protein
MVREGLLQEYIEATGAILAGRDGFDGAIRDKPPYGGVWQGPIFVLTHHLRTPARPKTSPSSAAPSRRRSASAWKPPAARTSRCSHHRSPSSYSRWGSSTRSTSTSPRCCSETASGSTTPPVANWCTWCAKVPNPPWRSTSATGRLNLVGGNPARTGSPSMVDRGRRRLVGPVRHARATVSPDRRETPTGQRIGPDRHVAGDGLASVKHASGSAAKRAVDCATRHWSTGRLPDRPPSHR